MKPNFREYLTGLTARCSSVSGYSLRWAIEERALEKRLVIEDQKVGGSSRLIARKHATLNILVEIYARLQGWGCSLAEDKYILEVLEDSDTKAGDRQETPVIQLGNKGDLPSYKNNEENLHERHVQGESGYVGGEV